MQSRFPTPGEYWCCTFSIRFCFKVPNVGQTSDTKVDYPTLSKFLRSNNILGKVAKSIGLTEKDAKAIEQKFFPNASL